MNKIAAAKIFIGVLALGLLFCNVSHASTRRQNWPKPVRRRGALPRSILVHAPVFSWPIRRDLFWISSYFGWRERKRLHAGLDLAAHRGTLVRAAADGVVREASHVGSYGNMVLIAHNNIFKSRYAHLQRMYVHTGQHIKKGQVIGRVGNTGNVSGRNGHHLHFEVLALNRPINPMRFFG